MINRYNTNLKHPVYSALTLSFASFGDAFLYPFLPQYADAMKIPVVWIGVLLSINRFVRIALNPIVVKLFARYGIRVITISASLIAILSTLGYGLDWGLLSLFLLRILWGMAFAVLRISSLAYAFEHEYVGLALGVGRSIQEAGPLMALWLGPMILSYFSISNTFCLLALISVPSLIYALSLPRLNYLPISKTTIKLSLPSLFNSLTFASSFIVEGVLIIVLGLFLERNSPLSTTWAVTALAAGYLAYRRLCSVLFSPISGAIADKVGFNRVFNFSLLMIILGLILLLMGWMAAGLIIIFTFNSVNSTVTPGGASHNESDKIKAMARNATWRDIGAALGTVVGGLLLSGYLLFETFAITTFILAVSLFIHLKKTNKK